MQLASGVITAGGTLGILIPPSVMIIVYAAVAGQSVVKLYAAAMFPGFFLAFLYLVYIVGWAMINPKIAPPLPEEQTRVPVPDWLRRFQAAYSPNMLVGLLTALFSPARAGASRPGAAPLQLLAAARQNFCRPRWCPFAARRAARSRLVWWYVVIHSAGGGVEEVVAGRAGAARQRQRRTRRRPTPAEQGPSTALLLCGFWLIAAVCALLHRPLLRRMDAERFEVVKLLTSSIMPLGILTVVVLAVILFGITTATESAGVGAAGAFLLALQARTLDWKRTKEAVFLTAKTTAMVCWLFVGSALFSAVFAHPRRSGAGRAAGCCR